MDGHHPRCRETGRGSGSDSGHADRPDSVVRRPPPPWKGIPLFENKVTDAVAKMQARIDGLDATKLATLEQAATLEMDLWLEAGPMASRLMIAGLLDQYAANSLHAIHEGFHDGATLAQRLVFVQIMGEWLDMRVKGVAV